MAQDDAEAVKWYRKAAEQGYAKAQYNLGVVYAQGQGVAKDDAEAVKWYRKAAEQGNAEAQYNLGVMYDNGEGVPQDDAEAVKWYRKAAEQGDARRKLPRRHVRQRQGVPQDDAEAVKWYRKAAEQGDAWAQSPRRLYADGRGVPQDDAEAVKWYRLAAEQGDAVAQVSIGRMYAEGQGVAQDYVQALMWLTLATLGLPLERNKGRRWKYAVTAQMTPAQIEEAKRLVQERKPTAGPAPDKHPTRWHPRQLRRGKQRMTGVTSRWRHSGGASPPSRDMPQPSTTSAFCIFRVKACRRTTR